MTVPFIPPIFIKDAKAECANCGKVFEAEGCKVCCSQLSVVCPNCGGHANVILGNRGIRND
ncbi:MAG: hypothetical protein KAT65_02545 [Methanophagales archaeon]|nr:hypothetical protein [Methanophagales archaeon]